MRGDLGIDIAMRSASFDTLHANLQVNGCNKDSFATAHTNNPLFTKLAPEQPDYIRLNPCYNPHLLLWEGETVLFHLVRSLACNQGIYFSLKFNWRLDMGALGTQ